MEDESESKPNRACSTEDQTSVVLLLLNSRMSATSSAKVDPSIASTLGATRTLKVTPVVCTTIANTTK